MSKSEETKRAGASDRRTGSGLSLSTMGDETLFLYSLSLGDLFFLKNVGVKLSKQEDIRMMDLLREGCDLDGSYDLGELGAVPEKNWQKATPYESSWATH